MNNEIVGDNMGAGLLEEEPVVDPFINLPNTIIEAP